MPPAEFILGEFPRTLDDRYRLSLPQELLEALGPPESDLILAKERPGTLSLWSAGQWQGQVDQGVELIRDKMRAGKLAGRIEEIQQFGRLLSTRHKLVRPSGRGRLTIPEGFREFLQVAQGGEAIVVGAGVCVEIWHPRSWLTYLDERMPEFRQLFDRLSS